MPRLSVLMPYRRAAATLAEAAASVLASDVDLELVAVDDNSPGDYQSPVDDDMPDYASDDSLGRGSSNDKARDRDRLPADGRVIHVQSGGVGIARALELGRRYCRAEVIARMDADDLVLPGRFEAQLDALRDGSLAVVGTQAELFGERVGEGMRRYVEWQNGLLSPSDHHHHIFVESPLCHPSTMLRATALESVGGYRDGDFPEDYELWLRLDAAGFHLAKVERVGVRWRQSSAQATYNDARYRREAFRAAKAPFLAQRIQMLRRNRKLVVFGAGANGKRLVRALEGRGLRADQWVDVDPRRIGRTARGAPIVDFHSRARDALVLITISDHSARARAREMLDAEDQRIGEDYLLTS